MAQQPNSEVAQPAPVRAAPDPRRAYRAHNGAWTLNGDELVQAAAGQDGLLLFGDFTWTDYDFTAEANALGHDGTFCLCFRVGANQRGEFGLINWQGKPDYLSVVSWGESAPLDTRPGGFQSGRWHSLRVRVRGKRCQLASPLSTLRLWEPDTGKELDHGGLAIPPSDPTLSYRPMPASKSPYLLRYLTDYADAGGVGQADGG